MQNILSEFLNAGLLPIGDDDEKLQLLESAADSLAKQITATPLLAHRFSLVSLDEKIPASDPVHRMAGTAILEKWQTMTNKLDSSPVQVYRAVILRAIEIAASENASVGFAFTLVAANRPMNVVGGKDQTAIASMLARFSEATLKQLTDNWIGTVDLSLPKLSSKPKKAKTGKDDLLLGLTRATGPTDKAGKAISNSNPHWPDSGEEWSRDFVSRATDTIYNGIQAAIKGITEDVEEVTRETIQSLVKGLERMAIRDAKSELLWIRTTLYSPSAGRSYRALSPHELLLHATLDTSRAVNCGAPPSVAFFLRELTQALTNEKLRVIEALAAIGPALSILPEGLRLAKDTLDTSGRRGLLDYAVRPNAGMAFECQTGFKDGYEESLPDLAVKLYRELQILKLLSEP